MYNMYSKMIIILNNVILYLLVYNILFYVREILSIKSFKKVYVVIYYKSLKNVSRVYATNIHVNLQYWRQVTFKKNENR